MSEVWPLYRRRLVLLPVAAQMIHRGAQLLWRDLLDVHWLLAGSFLIGAALVGATVLVRRPWERPHYVVAALAVGGPYLAYVGWIVGTRDLTGVALMTVGDLCLIPWLIATSWGGVQPKPIKGE